MKNDSIITARDGTSAQGVQISKRLVVLNSLSSLVATVINAAFYLWLYQYLLRQLGADEYSLLPIIMSLLMFFQLGALFFSAGFSRHIIEAYARNDRERVTSLVTSMFPLFLVSALTMLGLGWLVTKYLPSLLRIPPELVSDARLMAFLLFVKSAFFLVTVPFRSGFEVRQRFVLMNTLDVIRTLATILILTALLFGVSVRVLWVVLAQVTAGLALDTAILVISRALVPELRLSFHTFRFAVAREVVGFGTMISLIRTAHRLRIAADPIILNLFAAPSDVACYHIGTVVQRQVDRLQVILTRPLQPALIAMAATKKTQQLQSAFHRVNRYFLWSSTLVVIPLIVWREELIEAYVGPEFAPAATVMAIILTSLVLTSTVATTERIAMATGRVRALSGTTILLQLFNVGLTVILVSRFGFGAVGAATASLVTAFLALGLLLALALRMLEIPLHRWTTQSLIPGLLPGAAFALTLTGITTLGPIQDPLVEIMFKFSLGLIVFLVTTLAVMKAGERREIAGAIKRTRTALVRFRVT